MAKTSSNVISDFRKWLKGNGSLTPNSANSYITYLGVSYNNDLGLVPTDNVYNYMDVIEQFYQAGDMLYAVTVINNIIERINNLGTPLLKALNDQRSALKKLRVFLHSIKIMWKIELTFQKIIQIILLPQPWMISETLSLKTP